MIILSYVKFYSRGTPQPVSIVNMTGGHELPEPGDKIHAATAATVTIVLLVIVALPFVTCYFRHFYRRRLKLQRRQLDKAEELFRRLHAKSSPVQEESVVSVTSTNFPVGLDVRQRNGQVVATTSSADVDVEKGVECHQLQPVPYPAVSLSRRSTQDHFEDALEQHDIV